MISCDARRGGDSVGLEVHLNSMEKCQIWKCIFGRPKALCAFMAARHFTAQWEKGKKLEKSPFPWKIREFLRALKQRSALKTKLVLVLFLCC